MSDRYGEGVKLRILRQVLGGSRLSARLRASSAPGLSADDRGAVPAGPRSCSRPGALVLTNGFFDRFPDFYETSETSAFRWRLNLRHEAVITENRDILAGARVLDIASHDGRWSMAALEAGAASVEGIEARPDLIEHATKNLRGYGVDETRFRFIEGDVFEVLARENVEVDVVLCLGFFYHTLRHNELFTRMRQTGARYLVLDTEVHRSDETVIRIASEHVGREGNAVADEFSFGDIVLTGRPSMSALRLLAEGHGFTMENLADWDGLLRDNPQADQVRDYRIGRRISVTFRRAGEPQGASPSEQPVPGSGLDEAPRGRDEVAPRLR